MADIDLGRLKIEKGKAGFNKPRGRSWKYLVAGGIIIAIFVAVAMSGVLVPKVEVETASVSMVYPSQGFTKLSASGYVVAQRKAAVAAKATGRLEWLGVEEGSRVKRGQVIARLESEDVAATRAQAEASLEAAKFSREQADAGAGSARAALAQAEAELTDAKRNIDRIKELHGRGIVAKADMDAAEARFEKARAAVEGARQDVAASESARKAAGAQARAAKAALAGAAVNVEYTLIRAPFDAVVLTKNADLGDIVTPIGAAADAKAAVVTIADMGSLQVEADVSESNIAQVKAGDPCEITMDALPDRRFAGSVSAIVPTADRTKATVLVKVRFDKIDPRVLPEMSAKVAFLTRPAQPGEEAPRVAVSPAAVAEKAGRKVVYRIVEGKAVETPVTTGEKLGDFVEVSGVKPGDKVAITGLERLKDGVKVREGEK